MKKDIIQKIVKASGVAAGEMILIHFWGEDSDKGIANDFMAAVALQGATPILLQQSRSVNRDIFSSATNTSFDERYFSKFVEVDAVLDIFTYRPVVLGHDIGEEQYELYRQYIRRLFGELMKCKRFLQIRIPTQANAEESGLEVTDYIDRMNAAYDIDYDILKATCIQAVEEMKGFSHVMLKTGTDCVLEFELTGRTWHVDAGDGDWPCGEVYIAPRESMTNGTVFFEILYVEDVGKFSDVTLLVEQGKVVDSSCEEVKAFLKRLPPEGTVVCELGFGMNPKVKDLCGYTVLDEKMKGTFHIAIGANDMFGGENSAPLHIDFVGRGTFECTKV